MCWLQPSFRTINNRHYFYDALLNYSSYQELITLITHLSICLIMADNAFTSFYFRFRENI